MVPEASDRQPKCNADRGAIILGALLHDIGKFVQRAQPNPWTQDHPHWGEEWFTQVLAEKLTPVMGEAGRETVRSAILSHHNGIRCITLADGISAGMDRIPLDAEETGDPLDSLVSIFSCISTSEKPKKEMFHRPAALGEDSLSETFPIEQNRTTRGDYEKLLGRFNAGIEQSNLSRSNPIETINDLYFTLWKYTWGIPGAAYTDEPDISLFDHLKTSAAIAGCLYDYENGEISGRAASIDDPAFLLIGGDLSGIQSYIFEVLTQQGKVARRLRARSFYIQLVSEIATHCILDNLQEEWDRWTLTELDAEVFIALAAVEATGQNLLRFADAYELLKRRLAEKKLQEFLRPFKERRLLFVLSDAFPGGFLPRPLSAEFATADDTRKDVKKIEFVRPEEFAQISSGIALTPARFADPPAIKTRYVHNTVCRLSNTTLDEIGVYSLPEVFIPEMTLYLKTESDEWKARVVSLFEHLSKFGFGRRKSIGKGQFTVENVEEHAFPPVKNANGFVTLSNFCPHATDPTKGLYRIFVKYGKPGDEFTFCGNPFKRPLIMIRAGSVFYTKGPPGEF